MNTTGLGARALAGVLVVLGAALAGCTADAPRNTDGQVTASAAADVFSIRVGDCTGKLDGEEIDTADLVPCQDGHYFEAYAAMKMTGDTWPGSDEVTRQANQYCDTEFTSFVGISYDDSKTRSPL